MTKSKVNDVRSTGRFLLVHALLLTALLLAGCGRTGTGPDLYTVVGEVTLDGRPIPEGRILFRRADGDQKAFAAEIADGAYRLAAEPGQMKVEILASRIVPGKFDTSNGGPEPVGEMYIPKQYNSESVLTAEVTPSGTNRIPFELQSK